MSTAAWIDVCAVDEVPALGARTLSVGDTPIAIFRNAIDDCFAVLDRCPHKGGPLSQGIMFGNKVACPLHNWTIDLGTGCAEAPDVGCTTTFPLKVDAGRIWIQVA